jgi:site-specific DNA recombinase
LDIAPKRQWHLWHDALRRDITADSPHLAFRAASKWIKNPDSATLRQVQRPRNEWVLIEQPELRSVPEELWQRVKARQRHQQHERGEAVRRGLGKVGGRAPRYLFSGILKCTVCGSNYVQRGATQYVCSGYANGRVCTNGQTFRRTLMEDKLLVAIRDELLSHRGVERFKHKLIARVRQPAVDAGRLRKLEREAERIVDAIAGGLSSAALRKRLASTEVQLEQLRAASGLIDLKAIMAAISAAVECYRRLVRNLSSNTPGVNIQVGREITRSVAGQIPVKPGADGVPVAMLALNEVQLAAAGGTSDIEVVAGACYGMSRRCRARRGCDDLARGEAVSRLVAVARFGRHLHGCRGGQNAASPR